MPSTTVWAKASHVKAADLASPLRRNVFWRSSCSRSSPILAASASTSEGGTYRAASPPISGSDVRFAAITGAPQDMASRTGRPNPSYSERYRKARQPLRRAATASSGRKPVRWICRVSAHSRTIPPQFQPFCPTSRRCASGYFSTRRRNARITQVSPFRGSTVARLTKNGVWAGMPRARRTDSVCPPSAA